MHHTLNIARRAAQAAAKMIHRTLPEMQHLAVEEKHSNDFVTEADRLAEAAVVGSIREAFPEHGILAEESGTDQSDSEWQWIIDPLDGTSNFIHGYPHFAVSIACVKEDEPYSAVILDVMRNHEFYASKGAGAWLNGRRLRVSNRTELERALVCTGIPTISRAGAIRDSYFECLKAVSAKCSGIRRSGSAALDLAWVASGWLDAFFEIGLAPWDVAAGSLLIREAGGLVNDFEGGSDFLHGGKIIGGTPDCARQLRELVLPHLQNVSVPSTTEAEPQTSLSHLKPQVMTGRLEQEFARPTAYQQGKPSSSRSSDSRGERRGNGRFGDRDNRRGGRAGGREDRRPRAGGGRPAYAEGESRSNGRFGDRDNRRGGRSGGWEDRRPRAGGDRPSYSEGGNRSNGRFGDRDNRRGGRPGGWEDRRPRAGGDRPSYSEGGNRGNGRFGDRDNRRGGRSGGWEGRRPRAGGDRPAYSEGGNRGNGRFGDRDNRRFRTRTDRSSHPAAGEGGRGNRKRNLQRPGGKPTTRSNYSAKRNTSSRRQMPSR